MKNLTLSILVLISIYSCKKDESLTPLKKVNNSTENAEYDDGEERYEPVFKNYQSILTVTSVPLNFETFPLNIYISVS